ncbi:GPP34 family phosphoprotein [Actinoplanes sp. DH11]|uniref:GOLPH3/VPS74 family protein n=1 Tax=Actinoplanes sp. DH11 TaxID=2857011 RepID=UPI001E3A3EC8|nr:GPP34 family phosphoprotein [Actinoplanes sp. DH11]
MAVPGSLPQRVHLLAYDPAKGRVPMGSNLGVVLRAAALADLHLSGHLTDDRGRAVPGIRQPCHDPFLQTVLDQVAAAKPRAWKTWIGSRHRAAVVAVRRQLADGRWVRLEQRKVLGLFPATRVTVRDPRVRKELLGRVGSALKDPLDRVGPADAALVAVVAAADLTLVLDRAARRTHKRRIQQLTEHSGPVAPALRAWIRDAALGEVG